MNYGYIYVLITVFSTVLSQILFKIASERFNEAIGFLNMIFNMGYYFYAGLFFSCVSIVSWIFALSKLPLSHAYPYMSLCFPLVLFSSVILFSESISSVQWFGVVLIFFGLIILSN